MGIASEKLHYDLDYLTRLGINFWPMHILWKGKQGATPTNWSFDMKRWIEIEDIKAAVDSGRIVYADSKSYQVKKIKQEYMIVYHGGQMVGLHGAEGTPFERVMNGKLFWSE